MMLQTWKSVVSLDDKLNNDDGVAATAKANVIQLLKSPATYLNPNEETIKAAPRFSRSLVTLVNSVIIDTVGSSSYAIPVLGDVGDLFWAPMQSYMINTMYKTPWLTTLGFLEEILPFTDFIPTATLGWFVNNGEFIPAWGAQARNQLLKRKKK